jgi:antitoxin (DNA-binding transcriptional repressor) of toxin-antitoxin stability system
VKQVGIAELKSMLSEFLRVVQSGESITVLDRNRAVTQIIPIWKWPGVRVRKPASDSLTPNEVSLPKTTQQKIDIVELLLQERHSQR